MKIGEKKTSELCVILGCTERMKPMKTCLVTFNRATAEAIVTSRWIAEH